MMPPLDFIPGWVAPLVVSLAIGLLIGLQRETAHPAPAISGRFGGVRTFPLIAVGGFVTAFWWPDLTVFLVGLGVLGALLTASFIRSSIVTGPTGIATELAALLTWVLGGLTASGDLLPPVAIAVLATLLLASKQPLHTFIREYVGTEEMMAVSKFALVALVIYPLLPDQAFTSLHINPRQIWFMVLLVTGISFVGYFGVRILGPQKGILITALFGGMVSSTAVTLAFARLGRERPELASPLAGGIILAGTIMFLRQIVEVAAVNPSVLVPTVALMLPAGLVGFWFHRRNGRTPVPVELPLTNPFEIATALRFGALYGIVLALIQLAMMTFGTTGVYGVALLSGLVEVDAPTLSLLRLSRDGLIPAGVAVVGIVAAGLSNTLAKLGVVLVLGSRPLARAAIWAMGSMILAGLAAAAVYLLLF